MQIQHPFAVVTTSVDGDLLAITSRVDRAFTLRDLSRMIPDRSYSGIRKSADRLASQGILTTERVGRIHTYRFNRHHVAAGPIVQIARLGETLLDLLETSVSELHGDLVFAAVFGSAARNEMRSDSDIDLLFVQRGQSITDDFEASVGDLSEKIHQWTGNDVRPVIFAQGEIDPQDPLMKEVVRDGRILYGERAALRTN